MKSTCQECTTEFEHERHDHRKYCSRSCAAKSNNRRYPKRKAAVYHCSCGASITGKMFRQRGSCSDCAGTSKESKRAKYIAEWLAGDRPGGSDAGILSRIIREYLLSEAGEACSKCGFNTPHPDDGRSILEINHIDGNGTNHSPDNLEVICPNCHAQTPTYKGKNKDHGRRQVRRRRYHADQTY